MRDLHHLNEYQQLLVSALALVHEEDLVAIFRAIREHPESNTPIELMNAELDQGRTLMEALADPSPLYEHFLYDRVYFTVFLLEERAVRLNFGTHGPPSDLHAWKATMASTGVVEKMVHGYRSYPEGGAIKLCSISASGPCIETLIAPPRPARPKSPPRCTNSS